MKKYFFNPNDAQNSAQLAAMRRWFGEFLEKNIENLSLKTVDTGGVSNFEKNEFELDIEEQHCGESSCLHTETLLIATFPNPDGEPEKRYFRIRKPLVFIRKFDFAALQSIESPQAGAHKH